MGIKGFEQQEELAELFALHMELRRIQKKLAIVLAYQSTYAMLSIGSVEHEFYHITITGLYDSAIMDLARVFDSPGNSDNEHCTLRHLRLTCAQSCYFPCGEDDVFLKNLEQVGKKYSGMISEIKNRRNIKLAHLELNQALSFRNFPDVEKLILFHQDIMKALSAISTQITGMETREFNTSELVTRYAEVFKHAFKRDISDMEG